MDITAKFTRQNYLHSTTSKANLVISLTAPVIDGKQRPPLCVLPVLDTSGSMQGQKIEYAKKSILKLIEHLGANDFAGLVVFGPSAELVVPPQEATSGFKDRVRAIVNKISPRGGTNLEHGLSTAIRAVGDLDLPSSYLSRVILFTDGEPTCGITDKNRICDILSKGRGPITVSAFGYGLGSSRISRRVAYSGCDYEFLSRLSEGGAGNFAHVQDPDDAVSAFGKELGGLLSTYGTNLRVLVDPLKDHRISQVLSDVTVESQDVTGTTEIRIPDILGEETRNLVLEVDLAEQKNCVPRSVPVFSVKVWWSEVSDSGERVEKDGEARASIRFVRKESDLDKEDPELVRAVHLAKIVRAQIDAEEQAKKGDFKAAKLVFSGLLREVDDSNMRQAIEGVQWTYSADAYVSTSGSRYSTRRGLTRSVGVCSADAASSQVLSSALGEAQSSNSVQEATMLSFKED